VLCRASAQTDRTGSAQPDLVGTKTVTHRVDVSWDETRAGQSLVRTYSLHGDRLTLITDPSNDPASGHKTVRTVSWERPK
jgi:hypothetical protein